MTSATSGTIRYPIPRFDLLRIRDLKRAPVERPDALDVHIIHWVDIGIVIPWPVGMSREDAITAWAVERSKSAQEGG